MNRWRFAWVWTIDVVLVIALVGCASFPWPPNPKPTPTPEPTPKPCQPGSCPRDLQEPQQCVEGECVACPELPGALWSHEAPQPHCSTEARPIKHWPPERECPVFTEPCDPGPDPTCEPPGPVPSGYLEKQLIGIGDPTPEYHDEVFKATRALGDRRHCSFRQNLDAVAAQLALLLPGVPIISGKEATFIERTPGGVWGEYHTVSEGDSGWANSGRGKYKGAHHLEPLDCGGHFARWNQACPAPLGNGWHHCTPLVGPDGDYCREQGWTDGRLFCAPRPDGHDEREACEVQVMRGDPTWRSDGEVVLRSRLVAKAKGGTYVELCLTNGTHCSRREVDR